MKDEELAEEYFENKCLHSYADTEEELKEDVVPAFLAGLEEGRPKWHKVADGDLPKAENYYWSRNVLTQTNKGSSIIGFCDHAGKSWYEKSTNSIIPGVIAWCEIPKYTEEYENDRR